MSEGAIIYQGPRQRIEHYFWGLGYECPENMNVADFLVQIPTAEGIRFVRNEFSKVSVPNTTEKLVEAWKLSDMFIAMIREINLLKVKQNDIEVQCSDDEWSECDRQHYSESYWYYCLLLINRQFIQTKRNLGFIRSRLGQSVFIGAIMATLFFQLNKNDYRSIMGFIFFSILFLTLGNISLIPAIAVEREIFAKQSIALFYPTSSFVISQALVMYPLNIMETILFCSIIYSPAGLSLDEGGTRFMVFFFTCLLFSVTVAQLFRTITYLSSSVTMAQPLCGLSVVCMMLFSGYICPRDRIPEPWIWAYWSNPLSWAFQSLMINEFTSSSYDFHVAGYSESYGFRVLQSNAFHTDYIWVWYGMIVMLITYISLLVVTVVILNYIHVAEPHSMTSGQQSDVTPWPQKVSVDDTVEMPFERTSFVFKNLNYSIMKKSHGEILLLKNVSGFFKVGTLTALMGSSGAGKTTLLDVLAGRKTTGKISGEVSVNGKPKDEDSFRRCMGYVEQHDSLDPQDLVIEAIEFSAALRLSRDINITTRRAWYVLSVDIILNISNRYIQFS